MDDSQGLFPPYIQRAEEELLLADVDEVRGRRRSRAVLLYGPGGVGKTSLVRRLAQTDTNSETRWLDPVDVDDPEYWLLSNLERRVAEQLDPDNTYFKRYTDFLTSYESTPGDRISHDTIVGQLSRIKRVFNECYQRYIEGTGHTVVIVFDTVEAIRGMYLLVTLTQWMKALPRTLFVLSGRPMPEGGGADPIETELRDPHQPLEVVSRWLGEFTQDAAIGYLNESGIAGGVSDTERAALVHLTRGHPLWLAFAVYYMREYGLPEEASTPLAEIEAGMPFGGGMTDAGRELHEAFKRRLVTPYRSTRYWQEAVKRLAVVRQSVNKEIFKLLMDDRPNPSDATGADAIWTRLLATPWIRARANQRYITLHDAVAEELAQRIIPAEDQDSTWRRELWRRARDIYRNLTDSPAHELARQLESLEISLRSLGERLMLEGDDERPTQEEERASIANVGRLDGRRRQLDALKAVRLYYELLCAPQAGCELFIELFDRARADNEILLQERLVLEMQRFVPRDEASHTFNDVVGAAVEDIRSWLKQHPESHLDIGLRIAAHLGDNGQNQDAIWLLEDLPETSSDHVKRYRRYNQLGNAYVRAPGRAKDGLKFFQLALREAEEMDPRQEPNLRAEAHKELGFYYRQVGNWADADTAYRWARDAFAEAMDDRQPDHQREEIASIQTNWAYIKGLRGFYRDASNLVDSAITVRRELGRSHAEGLSLSVRGEIYRYERKWEKAWQSYENAEAIFQRLRTWPELGLVYQEQAICLIQAAADGVTLPIRDDPSERAEHLITIALDLCRDYNLRAYPSALNRAGRIVGRRDVQAGLEFLDQGATEAQRLPDGWFWFANLIEYCELCYRAWVETGDELYRARIAAAESHVADAANEFKFLDLEGRWKLLQGHLLVHDWTGNGSAADLDAAFTAYADGFIQLAQAYVGSSGASAIPAEFETFRIQFRRLPDVVQSDWRRRFRIAWAEAGEAGDPLLAHLVELY